MKNGVAWIVGAWMLSVSVGTAGAADFRWQRVLPAGQTLEIKGVNGDIEASAAPGDEVLVTARKSSRKHDVDSVSIEVVEHAGGVTICAVYPSSGTRRNTCAPGSGGHNSVRDNDVEVAFDVKVPRRIAFAARTVNGGIEARGLGGDVTAETVNGSVQLATEGHATAETVNGSIRVETGRADWTGTAEYRTVNGSIVVTLPASASADVSARSVNGEIESDFPMTVEPRTRHRRNRLEGTIGGGGRKLELETVNGGIAIKAGA